MSFFSKWQTHDDEIKAQKAELKQPLLQTASHVTGGPVRLSPGSVTCYGQNSPLLNVKTYKCAHA